MEKKLSKFGNSLALIIDKPILDLLNIDEKTSLTIKTDGEKIILIPTKKPVTLSDNTTVQKSFEHIMKEYAQAFQKLAKK